MAAVTADVSMRVYGEETTHRFILDTASAATCTGFKGEPLVLEIAAGDTVNPRYCHGVSDPEMKPTSIFVGVAKEAHVGALGDAETLLKSGVEAWIEPTILGWKSAVLTNADAGKKIYWVTGALHASTATDSCPLGHLMFVEDGYAYIKLETLVSTGAGA